jgi:hypothetical protein
MKKDVPSPERNHNTTIFCIDGGCQVSKCSSHDPLNKISVVDTDSEQYYNTSLLLLYTDKITVQSIVFELIWEWITKKWFSQYLDASKCIIF